MSGLRMTVQRRVILAELQRLDSHPTAAELWQAVRRRLPRISLGTVYRNLQCLTRQGAIGRIGIGGAEMRFDPTSRTHYHVRCQSCGCVEDVHIELLDRLEEAAAQRTDYRLVGHRLDFLGICPRCDGAGEGRRHGVRRHPARPGE